MARLPDPYRWLEPQLAAWAKWSRESKHNQANLLARLTAEAKVGASHKQDGPPAPIAMPTSVDRIEQAVCRLPDRRWQYVVIAEWHCHMRRIDLARRLHVHRDTLWVWRRHAYGALADALGASQACLGAGGG